MKVRDTAYLFAGLVIGVGVVFYQVDTPRADKCETYKVRQKPVTAYVLKPPPAEIRYEACPQTTAKAEPECQKLSDEKPESIEQTDKPRRHRRHHRVRRFWR